MKNEVEKIDNPQGNRVLPCVTNRNTQDESCNCQGITEYKQNLYGVYVCVKCEKKLPDNKIRSICSYYGW